MAQAILDENRIPTILGTSNLDGKTTLPIFANPVNHGLSVDDNTTGTDKGGNPDPRDTNRKIAFFAVSSADGVTPVAVYADSNNKLLVTST